MQYNTRMMCMLSESVAAEIHCPRSAQRCRFKCLAKADKMIQPSELPKSGMYTSPSGHMHIYCHFFVCLGKH